MQESLNAKMVGVPVGCESIEALSRDRGRSNQVDQHQICSFILARFLHACRLPSYHSVLTELCIVFISCSAEARASAGRIS